MTTDGWGAVSADVRTRTLQRLIHKVHRAFPANMLSTFDVELIPDHAGRAMVAELHAAVWAEALPPERIDRRVTVTFDVPASWWQHFKHDHRSRWWLRRLVAARPVRRVTHKRTATFSVDLRRYRTYPAAPFYEPRLGVEVQVTRLFTETGTAGPSALPPGG